MPLTLSPEIDVSEPESPDDSVQFVSKTISVEPEIWMEARLKSIRMGRPLSDVIRDFLKQWVDDDKSQVSGVE